MSLDLDIGIALVRPQEAFEFCLSEDVPSSEQAERLPENMTLSDVRINGTFMGVGESVFIRGSVGAVMKTTCVRCLADFESTIAADVKESYGREIDPNNPDCIVFTGSTLSLDEQAYSALIMALPISTLCRDDCAGLCYICGQALTEGDCGCFRESEIEEA